MSGPQRLALTVYGELRLEQGLADRLRARFRPSGQGRAVVDGIAHSCCRGAWAVWIPSLGLKFLNSFDGRLACLHPSAPRRDAVLHPAPATSASGPYSIEDWRTAFCTGVARRVAENAVATERLHRAGLGPRLLGLCVARRLIDHGRRDSTFAAGIVVEDAKQLPAREPVRDAEMVAAGVRPDRIRSSTRQQINGHVVDLNSVVGAMPIDAEDEITTIEAQILAGASITTSTI